MARTVQSADSVCWDLGAGGDAGREVVESGVVSDGTDFYQGLACCGDAVVFAPEATEIVVADDDLDGGVRGDALSDKTDGLCHVAVSRVVDCFNGADFGAGPFV